MAKSPEEPARDPRSDGPSDDEIDRLFAELTAGMDAPDGAEVVAHPAAEPPRVDAQRATPPEATPEPTGLGAGPRDFALAEEPDEGYVPPEPESLESADPLQVAAWFAAIGAPIAGVLLLVVWSSAPTLVWLTILALTLAGWAVVMWKLPRHRDDGDDGARV